jgi:histidyl-tRNA synthetase
MKRKDTELAVGGFRDFYPELYGKIDIILKAFRQVPKLFGYVEYECPTVEPLKLYKMKSGTALIEETFTVIDRKERRLVLRPETTPSLARMLAAQQQFYPRPIRWFSVSRVFRDETQQRGRVKEFWQLNVDFLGIEDIAADAEVINILADIILALGFTPTDFVIRINDRRLIQSFIESLGLSNYVDIIRVLDRRDKLLQESLEKQLCQQGYQTKKATDIALQLRRLAAGNQDAKTQLPKSERVQYLVDNLTAIIEEAVTEGLEKGGVPKEAAIKLTRFSSIRGSPAEFLQSMEYIELEPQIQKSLEPLRILAAHLKDLGIDDCCEFDASIARGLDYYTGIVFEAWDRDSNIPRAIAGGGRYDDLVSIFKGQRLPGTGFGFGETVLLQLAEEKRILPTPKPPATIYIAPVSKKQLSTCRQLAARLRREGIKTIFNGFPWSLTKHLEDAGKRKIPLAAIVGPKELAENAVNVRDLTTGTEKIVKINELVKFVRVYVDTVEKRGS